MTVDRHGRVYLTDSANRVIWRTDSRMRNLAPLVTRVDQPESKDASPVQAGEGFHPSGITPTSDDRILFTDGNRVYQIPAAGAPGHDPALRRYSILDWGGDLLRPAF
jgi:sugar lactone lactonase YvrE